MKKPLYLFDHLNIVYRMYYGVPTMNAQDNTPSNAIYGYLKTLKYVYNHAIDNYDTFPAVIVCNDVHGSSTRKDLYSEYKMNRTSEIPELLSIQMPLILELLKDNEITIIGKEGYEADDVISTIVKKYSKDYDIYILSNDKDLGQLVEDDVYCIDSLKQIVWSKENIKDRLGVDNKFIVDYLSLTGDSSDNIPGVKGIGDKGAIKLIEEFGSVEEIYSAIDEHKEALIASKRITNSIYNKLVEGRDMAHLSKKLATLVNDLDIDLPNNVIFDINKLNKDILRRYNIKSIINID